ncbi:hypothetical protein P691DRAFT_812823 [Macrolepiota fuliginosa MF-IS2]|uniref:Uncharacterized protein n=1 Tax=Macrolepiota fuliginosa MF-IS2 TaxID=1400762 RepID=A0A9P6C2Q8_9AGAR|nr:hypothetical protein P691DRAFT_812823 [Macrolepiota fuliginosa MF-IS2]
MGSRLSQSNSFVTAAVLRAVASWPPPHPKNHETPSTHNSKAQRCFIHLISSPTLPRGAEATASAGACWATGIPNSRQKSNRRPKKR